MAHTRELAIVTISCSICSNREQKNDLLASDLRSQADYIRGCLKFGNLGYADAKMLEKIELAAARITHQHGDLSELKAEIERQESQNKKLSDVRSELENSNAQMRKALESVIDELSNTLANVDSSNSGQNGLSNYKMFDVLECAKTALK